MESQHVDFGVPRQHYVGPVDHSRMKLGKRAAKNEPGRRLMLRNYVMPNLALPVAVDWTRGIKQWGMMGNDSLGDCTIAGVGHALQVISANVDSMITVPDPQIVDYYSKWDGYVPGDPNTDNGGVEVDVLNQWRKNKFAGHQLLAYADPDPGNIEHIKLAIALFGGVYIGLELPLSAQNQAIWDVSGSSIDPANAPGSWGGHCVFVVAYGASGLTCITWGGLKQMTWPWWAKYCDEAHALALGYWFRKGAAPSGLLFGDNGGDETFRINALVADVEQLAN